MGMSKTYAGNVCEQEQVSTWEWHSVCTVCEGVWTSWQEGMGDEL